ncbi:transposase [Streptomyces sp. JV184]|uniref:transposase n=1 Tax=Streptomyces sp. JV184 TaxID=858637 RepID=UPI003FA6E6F9
MTWLADHEDAIELRFLPSHSPELNPDEQVDADLKRSLPPHPPGPEYTGMCPEGNEWPEGGRKHRSFPPARSARPPARDARQRYSAYPSSTRSTSGSLAGGSCRTISSMPSSA